MVGVAQLVEHLVVVQDVAVRVPSSPRGQAGSGNDRRGGSMTYYPSHPTSAVPISTARLTAATVAGRLAGAASRIARRGTGASIQGK